jgi:DNA-binding response OmpR family regulator
MIVDDDRTMVSLLKILLEMDGFEVIDESRRGHVVPTVMDKQPDIVLMDVFLSDGDGMELLKLIRQAQLQKPVKVIMTSGMELSEQCRQAGADDFLLKPYTPEQLAQVINNNLGAAAH